MSDPDLIALLSRLRKEGIVIWKEGQRLRYNAPKGAMTSDLQDRIKSCKPALLEYLGAARTTAVGTRAGAPVSCGAQEGFARLERRSLVELTREGKLEGVEAAWIIYGSMDHLAAAGLEGGFPDGLLDRSPWYYSVMDTSLGRIALVMIPRTSAELGDMDQVVPEIVDALELSATLGAKVASLAGVLAFLTDYGRMLTRAVGDREDLPTVTTGHDTTAAAVVINCRDLLLAAGRDISKEDVAVLGLGSIGTASTELLIDRGFHPRRLVLCDLESRQNDLEVFRHRLLGELGFSGEVEIALSDPEIPGRVYDSTFILGATSVADVIDVPRLRPGTLICDDSYPPCISPAGAFQRLDERGDILFTDAGLLQAAEPVPEVVYLPGPLHQLALSGQISPSHRQTCSTIHSCTLAALIPVRFPHLAPCTGPIGLEQSRAQFEALLGAAYSGAEPQLSRFVTCADAIHQFRRRWGAHGT